MTTIDLHKQGIINRLQLHVPARLMEVYRSKAPRGIFLTSQLAYIRKHEVILSGYFISNKGTDFCLTEPVLFWSSKYYNPITESYLWAALEKRVIDGASIPKLGWTLMGSPFSGRYKRSAAVHDVECKDKDTDYQTVHALFAEMIEVEGVDGWKLTAMAKSVQWRGPRW